MAIRRKEIMLEVTAAEKEVLQTLVYGYEEVKGIRRIEEFHLDWFPTTEGKRIWQALIECKRYDTEEHKQKIDEAEFHKNLRKRTVGWDELRSCEKYYSDLNKNEINYYTYEDNVNSLISNSELSQMRSDAENTLNIAPDLSEVRSILWRKRKMLEELEEKSKGIKTETIVDVFADYDECIKDAKVKGKEPYLTVGYEGINKKVKKLKEGRLVVIAARPGLGKTTFALNIVINNLRFVNKEVKDSMSIGFISLEMTRLELLKKLICIRQNCLLSAVDEVMDGESTDTTTINQISNARTHLEKSNILFWDKGNIDIGQLVAQIKRWHAESPNLKLVIIDYLQLVGSLEKDGDETRQQQIGVSSRTLKLLAQELNICILALAQLNRKIEDRRSSEKSPQLADLRESGDIEQDADVVMCIYEAFIQQGQQQWNPGDQSMKPMKETRITILKNRHGGTGEVEFYFNKGTGKFKQEREILD